MRTIIAGSRSLKKMQYLNQALLACPWFENITFVIAGGASGIDTLAIRWAKANDLPWKIIPADWDGHPSKKGAGMARNWEMATRHEAEALLAVHDGISTGTAGMIKIARHCKLHPIFVHQIQLRR